MRVPPIVWLLLVAVLGAAAPGCAPSIGDSCNNALNCSINGDRQCDLTRPSGACTVFGCEADTCPDDAVCVRWRPDPSRLTFTACMRRCDSDNNCRIDEGYMCFAASELDTENGPLAEVIDLDRMDDGRFCVATQPPSD
ncbi:MAG: hypothetical protein AB7S26_04365 [Sandaracinaceae bacterium]